MIITYSGLEFFKIQSGNLTLVFNPVSRDSKLKIAPPRFKSDVALVSLNHSDFNGTQGLLSKDDKVPFIVDGPGEYEIQDIFIKGFRSKSLYDGQEKINTIYRVVMEGIVMCFLGALSEKSLADDILAELEGTEILFIPIGGHDTLDASDAYKLSVKISPNVIIPMHYTAGGQKDVLKKFLKEEGIKDIKPVDKLTTKKSSLALQSGDIVVLKSSND